MFLSVRFDWMSSREIVGILPYFSEKKWFILDEIRVPVCDSTISSDSEYCQPLCI